MYSLFESYNKLDLPTNFISEKEFNIIGKKCAEQLKYFDYQGFQLCLLRTPTFVLKPFAPLRLGATALLLLLATGGR